MTKIDMDTASGQRGRYANLSRLLGEFRCCRFLRDGKSADGIIVGLWTADDGTPQCVVLTADGCLNRINLEKVRISNAQVKVNPTIAASTEKRPQRVTINNPCDVKLVQ